MSNSYQKPTINMPEATMEQMEVSTTKEAEDNQFEDSSMIRRSNKPMMYAVGAFAVFALMMVSMRPTSSVVATAPLEAADVPLWGSSKVTPCSFQECASSNCNAEVAPYTCLFHNGGPHGGCSPTPWLEGTCTTQCDMTGCDDLDIPDDVADCSGDCEEDWCAMGRLCGDDIPYQCTDGASAFGCSADKYQWTFRVSHAACSSCCKVTSC